MGNNIKLWDIGSASHDKLLLIIQQFVEDGYEAVFNTYLGKDYTSKIKKSVAKVIEEMEDEISEEIVKKEKIFKGLVKKEIERKNKEKLKELVSDVIYKFNEDEGDY